MTHHSAEQGEGLHVERTQLAWRRTAALSLLAIASGVGLLLAKGSCEPVPWALVSGTGVATPVLCGVRASRLEVSGPMNAAFAAAVATCIAGLGGATTLILLTVS